MAENKKGEEYLLLNPGQTLFGRVVRDPEIVPLSHMPKDFPNLTTQEQLEKYGKVYYQPHEASYEEKKAAQKRLRLSGFVTPPEDEAHKEAVRQHLSGEDAHEQAIAIEEMSTAELRAEGKKHNLNFPKSMKKEQMVGALTKVKAAEAEEEDDEDEEEEEVESEEETVDDSDESDDDEEEEDE